MNHLQRWALRTAIIVSVGITGVSLLKNYENNRHQEEYSQWCASLVQKEKKGFIEACESSNFYNNPLLQLIETERDRKLKQYNCDTTCEEWRCSLSYRCIKEECTQPSYEARFIPELCSVQEKTFKIVSIENYQ